METPLITELPTLEWNLIKLGDQLFLPIIFSDRGYKLPDLDLANQDKKEQRPPPVRLMFSKPYLMSSEEKL